MTRSRRGGAAALVIAAALLLLGLLTGPAAAQDGGFEWSIDSFIATITVDDDGTMHVVEDIAVDFRNLSRHGIFRVMPVRYDLTATGSGFDLPEGRRADEYQRKIEVTDIEVQSSAPDNLVIETPDLRSRLLRIRIGDEDKTVTGPQTYRISYTVRGALNAFEGHGELYWNVTGTEWEVPIQRAVATVTAPAVREGTCFRGTIGATGLCDRAEVGKRQALFVAKNVQPGEGLTVVTAFPRNAVTVPPPLVVERWTPRRALIGSSLAIPGAVGVAVLGFAGLLLLAFRQGRDRVTRARGLTEEREGDAGTRRGLFAARVTPVEFRPPEDLRPAQVGLLADERVDPVDISATIVDLAVRGHLRITEISTPRLWRRRTDWELTRLDAPDDALLPYEERLRNGLFKSGATVLVSDLKGKFASTYKAVEGQLYADAVRHKWFAKRPDSVRTRWLVLGVICTVLAIAGFVAAMFFTTWALAVAPLILVGLAMMIAHRWMPHRTATGSRMLDQVLGFRQFIANAEAGRAEYAEQQQLFIPYLPYAMVFGVVDKWARTFAELGVATPENGGVGVWYVGSGPFDARTFSSGMSEFATAVGTSLPTAPPSASGSSGFSGGSSGGGFGGGGGGSW